MQVSVGDRDSDRMEMRPWYNFVLFFFSKIFILLCGLLTPFCPLATSSLPQVITVSSICELVTPVT